MINRLPAHGKKALHSLCFHGFVLLFATIMIYPLIWMLCASFKDSSEIFSSAALWPAHWSLTNYVEGWHGLPSATFGLFFSNTLLIVAAALVGNVLSCSMAAYAFAKTEFVGRGFFFALMMGTLMLPKHVKLIPQYIIFNHLDMVNTFWPLILPKFMAVEGFFVYLMTQYMRGLPRELDEAARIDGCGAFQHYRRIILPLSVPAIISTCIFTFIWTWNDFFNQMIYITSLSKYTVSTALRMFIDATGTSSWGALFAMSVLSLVPMLVIFILFQGYLVDGVTAGSVKG